MSEARPAPSAGAFLACCSLDRFDDFVLYLATAFFPESLVLPQTEHVSRPPLLTRQAMELSLVQYKAERGEEAAFPPLLQLGRDERIFPRIPRGMRVRRHNRAAQLRQARAALTLNPLYRTAMSPKLMPYRETE